MLRSVLSLEGCWQVLLEKTHAMMIVRGMCTSRKAESFLEIPNTSLFVAIYWLISILNSDYVEKNIKGISHFHFHLLS